MAKNIFQKLGLSKVLTKKRLFDVYHVLRRCALKGAFELPTTAHIIIGIEFLQMITLNLSSTTYAEQDVVSQLLDTALNCLSVVRLFKYLNFSVAILYVIFSTYYLILHLSLLLFYVYYKFLGKLKIVRRFLTLLLIPLDLQNTIFQVSTTELILEGIACASLSTLNPVCGTQMHGFLIFTSVFLLILNVNASLLANLFTYLEDFSERKKDVQFAKNYNLHYTLLVLLKVIMVVLFKFSLTRELSILSQCYNCATGLFLTYVYFKNLSYINENICQSFGMWQFIFTVISGLLLLQTIFEYIPLLDFHRYPRAVMYLVFGPMSARLFFNLRERLIMNIIASKSISDISELHFEFLMRQIWFALYVPNDNYKRMLRLLLILTNFQLTDTVEFKLENTAAPPTSNELDDDNNVLDDLNTHPLILTPQKALKSFIEYGYNLKLQVATDEQKYFGAFMNLMSYYKNIAKNYSKPFRMIAQYREKYKGKLNILNLMILNEYEIELLEELERKYQNIDINFLKIKSFMDFHDYLEEIKEMIAELMPELVQLYETFQAPVVNLQILRDKGGVLLKKISRIQKIFNKAVTITDKQKELYGVYFFFRTQIIEYFCLQNVKLKEKFALSNIYNRYDPFEGVELDLADPKQNHFVYVSLTHPVGKIHKYSVSFADLFEYERREITDMKLNTLMPGMFAKQHDQFLIDATEKGELLKSKYPNRMIFGLNKHHLIIPLLISLKIDVFEGRLCAAAMLKAPKNSKSKFILCERATGKILGMNTELAMQTLYDEGDLKFLYTLFKIQDLLSEWSLHSNGREHTSPAASPTAHEKNFDKKSVEKPPHSPINSDRVQLLDSKKKSYLFLPINLRFSCRGLLSANADGSPIARTGRIASHEIQESRNFRVYSLKYDITVRSYGEGALDVLVIDFHSMQELKIHSVKEVFVKNFVANSSVYKEMHSMQSMKRFKQHAITLRMESNQMPVMASPRATSSSSSLKIFDRLHKKAATLKNQHKSSWEKKEKENEKENEKEKEKEGKNDSMDVDPADASIADEVGIKDIGMSVLSSYPELSTTRQMMAPHGMTEYFVEGDETSRIEISQRNDITQPNIDLTPDQSFLKPTEEVPPRVKHENHAKIQENRRFSFAPLQNELQLQFLHDSSNLINANLQDGRPKNNLLPFIHLFEGQRKQLNSPHHDPPAFGRLKSGQEDAKMILEEESKRDSSEQSSQQTYTPKDIIFGTTEAPEMFTKITIRQTSKAADSEELSEIVEVSSPQLKNDHKTEKHPVPELGLEQVVLRTTDSKPVSERQRGSVDYGRALHIDLTPDKGKTEGVAIETPFSIIKKRLALLDDNSPSHHTHHDSSIRTDFDKGEALDEKGGIYQNGVGAKDRKEEDLKSILKSGRPASIAQSKHLTKLLKSLEEKDHSDDEHGSKSFTDEAISKDGAEPQGGARMIRRFTVRNTLPLGREKSSSESSRMLRDPSSRDVFESLRNLDSKPPFFRLMRSIGWLAFITLQLLTLVVYLLVDSRLSEFSTLISVADHAAYLKGSLGVAFAASELAYMINRGWISNQTLVEELQSQRNLLLNVSETNFTATYLQYVLSDQKTIGIFDENGFVIDFDDELILDGFNYIESSSMGLAAIRNTFDLNITNFATGDEILVFFRDYYLDYYNIYTNVTNVIFQKVLVQEDAISSSLLIELILGILMSTGMCILIYCVILFFEKRENQCLNLFCKFSVREHMEIQKQIIDKTLVFFDNINPESIKNTTTHAVVRALSDHLAEELNGNVIGFMRTRKVPVEKTAKKKKFSNSSSRDYRSVRYNWVVVSIFLLANMLLIGFYFIFYYARMKNSVNVFIPAVNNYQQISDTFGYIPSVTGTIYYLISEYFESGNANLTNSTIAAEFQSIISNISIERSAFQNYFTQELNSELNASFITDESRAQLQEYLSSGFCTGTTDNSTLAPDCGELLNGAAQLGIINVYNQIMQYYAKLGALVTQPMDQSNISKVIDSQEFAETYLMTYYLHLAIIDIIVLQQEDIEANIESNQLFIRWYFIIGVISLAFFFLFFWNIFMNRISNSFLKAKQLLRLIPLDNLKQNAYIKAALTVRKGV